MPSERWVVVGGGVLGTVIAAAGLRRGHRVTLLEAGPGLGGLTATQVLETDAGPVECDRFYHVILESDTRLLALLEQVGLRDTVRWTSAPAIVAAGGSQFPATSLVDMARLPALKAIDRARTGLSIGVSLLLPLRVANTVTASTWLKAVAGKSAHAAFWTPILRAKLGTQSEAVSAAFIVSTFRRLIRARLSGAGDKFGVLPQGYGPVFGRLRAQVIDEGGDVRADARVTAARPTDEGVVVEVAGAETIVADRVIVTTPGPVTAMLVPNLSEDERRQLTGAPYLGVVCGTFLVRTPPNDAYITYLVDDVGVTAVIGMHALIDSATTGGLHLVYVPRYCSPDDPWFEESDEVILERLLSAVRRALPGSMTDVVTASVNRARHVVPLPTPDAPAAVPVTTSVPGVHVVSAAQNRSGTLNVEGSLAMAASALEEILAGSPS